MTEQQITLVYAGRRFGKNSKVIHEWRRDERELWFDKVAGSAIGGIYTVEADVDGDRVSVYQANLRCTGEKIDDSDQIAVWQADDQHTPAPSPPSRRPSASTRSPPSWTTPSWRSCESCSEPEPGPRPRQSSGS